mmetsp:Transcript_11654/g.30363  ORF Transcript_11654/g.30363 Transcript_11654/m.30363 type:complete len:307 (+) Transcript_11654:263-1183(+)
MRSDRPLLPICPRLSAVRFSSSRSCSAASSRLRSIFMAFARFCDCARSSWHWAVMPVGMCKMRTAESVVFTCCPPAPDARHVSMRRSASRSSMSASSASGSTATEAVLVWMRPIFSVAGTRCTRWTPDSYRNVGSAPNPRRSTAASLHPPDGASLRPSSSTVHCRRAAYDVYIPNRSRAKRAASSPPAPARTSRTAPLTSLSAAESRRSSSWSTLAALRASSVQACSHASSSSRASWRSSASASSARNRCSCAASSFFATSFPCSSAASASRDASCASCTYRADAKSLIAAISSWSWSWRRAIAAS